MNGNLYLFIERAPLKTHITLRKELSSGRKVMYVSNNPPSVLENQIKCDDDSLKFIWLTPRIDQSCIPPMNLKMMEDVIGKFLTKNQDGMIVIDGLEVLEMWNGFMPIVKMIERLKTRLKEPDKAIIISLDPNRFEVNNINRLEKVIDVVVATA